MRPQGSAPEKLPLIAGAAPLLPAAARLQPSASAASMSSAAHGAVPVFAVAEEGLQQPPSAFFYANRGEREKVLKKSQ